MSLNLHVSAKYLTAAVIVSLLQSASVPALAKSAAAKSPAPPAGPRQTVAADHSAEFEPVRNEFLKEGEGVPGSRHSVYDERKRPKGERKETDRLTKELKKLQLQREAFLKAREKAKKDERDAFAKAFAGRQEYSIVFDPNDYTAKTMNANGETVSFRAYENLVYVKKPYDPESQMLSIYIPEGYFRGKTVNGFTAETAPVFIPNSVRGYLPGTVAGPREESRHGGANAALYALSNGYVVVSPAVRGRSLKHGNGYGTGKAPALIVDYKAAIRFVRQNRKAGRIPAGDTEKIVVSGTGAGGALASLAGATGNAKDYEPYLKELGAADGRDDVFAVMAYCPVTNLENADMAYEWMFRTPEQNPVSSELAERFTGYLNSLNLRDSLGNKLNLAPDGDGLFREYIESLYLASAQDAIDTGETVSGTPWILISEGKAVKMDFPAYVNTVKRLKGIPAFDAFDMSTAGNNEFGTAGIENRHFTRYALEHDRNVSVPEREDAAGNRENLSLHASPPERLRLQIQRLQEQMERDKTDLSLYLADEKTVKLMNPMQFAGNASVKTAPNWRIRHGALDRDISPAIPAILALKLKNSGCTVDFKVPWGYGHDGDYDLPDMFAWTDRVCKIKDKADAMLKTKQKKRESAAKE